MMLAPYPLPSSRAWLPTRPPATPTSCSSEKEDWVESKYKQLEFVSQSWACGALTAQLCLACWEDDVRTAWRSLVQGASVEAATELRPSSSDKGVLPTGVALTPLQHSALRDSERCVELLAHWGANLGHPGPSAVPPLHLACRHGHARAVAALLRRGADPLQLDSHGNDAASVATSAGYADIAAQVEAMAAKDRVSAERARAQPGASGDTDERGAMVDAVAGDVSLGPRKTFARHGRSSSLGSRVLSGFRRAIVQGPEGAEGSSQEPSPARGGKATIVEVASTPPQGQPPLPSPPPSGGQSRRTPQPSSTSAHRPPRQGRPASASSHIRVAGEELDLAAAASSSRPAAIASGGPLPLRESSMTSESSDIAE